MYFSSKQLLMRKTSYISGTDWSPKSDFHQNKFLFLTELYYLVQHLVAYGIVIILVTSEIFLHFTNLWFCSNLYSAFLSVAIFYGILRLTNYN